MKHAFILAIVVALTSSAASLSAHWPFRIVGTIATLSDTQLHVKRGGQVIKINLTHHTTVKRDKDEAELKLSVLKVGQTVVVDAEGDDLRSLDAFTIRIVPAIDAESAK